MHQALVAAKLVTMGLGFLIAYQAYLGHRRLRSTALFYVAIGFFLISLGSVIEGVLFEFLDTSIFIAGAIQTAIVAAGMLAVLYSLYGDVTHQPPAPERSGATTEPDPTRDRGTDRRE